MALLAALALSFVGMLALHRLMENAIIFLDLRLEDVHRSK